MSQFHFVEEFEAHVAALQAHFPRDQAMRLAVGGDYDAIGTAQLAIFEMLRLHENMTVIDLGCGSGRTAKHLARRYPRLDYLGLDIVEDLLVYAREQVPGRANYRFELSRSLRLPCRDSSVDIVAAFSVFTHLLHQETYCYLEEARRVLRPGGRVVFSFLDCEENWPVFEDMVRLAREGQQGPHLNMFIDRAAIRVWARSLHFDMEATLSGAHSPIGQSLAVLRKL